MEKKREKWTLEQILGEKINLPYSDQCEYIHMLIADGKITPVSSSPTNGKKPALYMKYWKNLEVKDYSELIEELQMRTHPKIDISYYLSNPAIYANERKAVRQLNSFLKTNRNSLLKQISLNERSFEIWGYEKFLSEGIGKTILKHCGIDMEFLNCYGTCEPFSYFAAKRNTPQNLLILENKDPFFSMRRHLLSGKESIFGTCIGTLIYGGGKRVVSSFKEFDLSAEPYMKVAGNTLLYFGDLDYEGILIFESLAEIFKEQGEIIPFIPAYIAMLDKGDCAEEIPTMKEGQNKNISNVFFSYFDEETVRRMKNYLEKGKYLPQEILNINDF